MRGGELLAAVVWTSLAGCTGLIDGTTGGRDPEPVSPTTSSDGAFDGYDIVVIAGQSNAVGQGLGDYLDDRSLAVEDGLIFQIGRRGANNGQVIPAADPLDYWVIPSDWFGKGFAMPFARRYAQTLLAPNRRIMLVPAAYGGTIIAQWDVGSPYLVSNPDGSQTSLYVDMKQRIQMALDQPGDNRLVAVLWQQGESDVIAFAQANSVISSPTDYARHVATMAGALRTDFAAQGCFPFLAGEMSPEWANWPDTDPQGILVYKASVTTELVNVLPSIGCSSFVDSTGLEGNADDPNGWDRIHFTAASQAILAQRYLAALGH